jgi:dihydrofolate synthase/folylpolyglutamate synthase
LNKIAGKIITVSGTNGKGSTVAYYETWLKNNGHSVASYTSPHLLDYNERIKLNLRTVTDQKLCAAFEQVDQARLTEELTYFEFGTLAAMVLISEFCPEYAILEIGLGGRLDAVNIVHADLAHITNIGLDHQDWLGTTRQEIGFEKAGILRDHGLAVFNDTDPPDSVISELERHHCRYYMIGRDYAFNWLENGFIEWHAGNRSIVLNPPLLGEHQALNISGVLAGLELLGSLHGKTDEAIANGFTGVSCPGRLQAVTSSLPAPLIIDVGHNEEAAKMLALYLKKNSPEGRVVVILGMLQDKNPLAFVEALWPVVNQWWLLSLHVPRGLSAQELANRIGSRVSHPYLFDSVQKVMEYAMSSLNNQDIILATGSFMTVEAVLNSTLVTLE